MKCEECIHKRYHLSNLERRRKWYEENKLKCKKYYIEWLEKKEREIERLSTLSALENTNGTP